MSHFIGQLKTRSLFPDEIKAADRDPDVQLWELLEEFAFYSDGLGRVITVPAGFVTDLASIPRLVQNILPNDHPTIEMPSVIHDHLYTTKTTTREQADGVLREGMELQGASGFVRNAVYRILRMFGGAHWNSK